MLLTSMEKIKILVDNKETYDNTITIMITEMITAIT